MTIRYTSHALRKFNDLDALGVHVTKRLIHSILTNPHTVDTESDRPNIITSGILDTRHLLRVVYRMEDAIILVITFYPVRKERYFV